MNQKSKTKNSSSFKSSIRSESENYNPQDEANYYEGDNFELGGIDISVEKQDGQKEEEARNLARFGEKFWNERDYAGAGGSSSVSDQRLFEAACEALKDNPFVDASMMEVGVFDGVIYLRGHISNRNQKREAEQAIENIRGVKDVMNELKIKS